MALDRHPSGEPFDRSEIARVDEAALDRPGGSPKRSAGQPHQGLIWSLLAMGLAACGGGGGGGCRHQRWDDRTGG